MAPFVTYVTGVVPLIAAAGGELVNRGRPQETVVCDAGNQPDLVAVMRFPGGDYFTTCTCTAASCWSAVPGTITR